MTLGLWQYAHAPHIAYGYDDYFAQNSLFEFDESVLARHFTRPGTLLDLGCGSGRLLVPFARRGFRGLAVDLSMPMLEVVGRKAREEGLPIDRLRANLTQLDCLRDEAADYAMCMFSTLGMVRGWQNRRAVLRHTRRILKPGGKFVLHVHNRWYNLFDPQGRVWVLRNLAAAVLRGNQEPGDKFFDYRGIPNMFLHVFTRRELTTDLTAAGFRIIEFIALDTQR
ncbi:MAG: class I SAM-dependent methyltransferase, partial [Candidatus Saccharimonadales bacterium]